MANLPAPTVTNLPELPPLAELGPAMKALKTERQRAFAWAFVTNGGNAGRAAAEAGYSPGNIDGARVTGHRLAHTEAVLEAIHECCTRLIHSATPAAIRALLEIVNTVGAKDRARAAELILSRTGFPQTTEHMVKVKKDEHTEAEMIAICVKIAKELGVPGSKLIGSLAPIDAEFEERSTAGLEDILDG